MKVPPWCTKCSTPLTADFAKAGQYLPCPKCQSQVRLEIFPAYFREMAKGARGEALVIDSEASCFYHPQKRAAVVCGACGRYLCALCDMELDGAHYCPGCVEGAKEKGKIKAIENKRTMYDTLAFQLAIVGFVPPILYFSLLTAPASIYYAIKYWNAPSSIVRGPSRWRQVTAIIVGSLQLLGWIAGIGFLLTR